MRIQNPQDIAAAVGAAGQQVRGRPCIVVLLSNRDSLSFPDQE
jgi:hypothetical protein